MSTPKLKSHNNGGETDALFRAQALAHQSSHLFGRVKLLMPVRYAVAAGVSIALAASTLALGYVGEYTKKARVAGVLVPRAGAAKITPTSGGVVLERKAEEGQRVEAGALLFVLSGERDSDQGATTALIGQQIEQRRIAIEAEGRAALAQLAIRAASLADRAFALERELSQVAAEQAILAQRVSLAKVTVARHDELAAKGFLSPAQAQQRHEELMEQQAREQASSRSETALKRERDSLLAQRKEISAQIDAQKEQTVRSLAGLQQEGLENAARRRTLVLAPRAGTVTAIAAEPGATVGPGATLATLLPEDATLEAHIYVPGRAAGFIEPKQAVLLRYDTYPYQKFGQADGVVKEITKSPFALNELPPNVAAAVAVPASQIGNANEAVYRVTVTIKEQSIMAYGKPQPLKAGMTLEADVQQDKRRLYEWVLEPVFGFVGRM